MKTYAPDSLDETPGLRRIAPAPPTTIRRRERHTARELRDNLAGWPDTVRNRHRLTK